MGPSPVLLHNGYEEVEKGSSYPSANMMEAYAAFGHPTALGGTARDFCHNAGRALGSFLRFGGVRQPQAAAGRHDLALQRVRFRCRCNDRRLLRSVKEGDNASGDGGSFGSSDVGLYVLFQQQALGLQLPRGGGHQVDVGGVVVIALVQ